MDTSWNSRNVARLRIFEKLYLARVARWFICIPKIPSLEGLEMKNVGIFHGHLVNFVVI
jgi:hypothetical protein